MGIRARSEFNHRCLDERKGLAEDDLPTKMTDKDDQPAKTGKDRRRAAKSGVPVNLSL